MSAVMNGAMSDLESDLAKYPEPGDPNRAILIRRALRNAEARGWAGGYSDGLMDGHDRRDPAVGR